jgi:hypothetical protein
LPVVAHDWSSTRWLFEDKAILVDTGDAEKVRSGLTTALTPRSADEVAARVSLVKRRFTWKTVATQYAHCLETVVANRSS